VKAGSLKAFRQRFGRSGIYSLERQEIMSDDTDTSREKLTSDLRTVIADAEELLRATAGQMGEKAVVARERIQESLRVAKDKLSRAEEAMVDRTKAAARVTDDYVHDHPWGAVGIAAAAGLVLGMLISRR
jgi:ElaB/YqjD/DUF883 family membrane-anchored ribosome-binding protein